MTTAQLKDMNILFHVRNKSAEYQTITFRVGKTEIEFYVVIPKVQNKYTLLKPVSFKITKRQGNKIFVSVETVPSNMKLTSDIRSDALNILEFQNSNKYYVFGKDIIKLNTRINTAKKEYKLISNNYKIICKNTSEKYMNFVYNQLNDRIKNMNEIRNLLGE